MGERWHSSCECQQCGGGPAHGVGFESLAAGQHEHDERARQVFPEHDRRDDGNAGQQVGAELETRHASRQTADEWYSAHHQSHDERNRRPRDPEERVFDCEGEAQHEVTRDRDDRDRSDDNVS